MCAALATNETIALRGRLFAASLAMHDDRDRFDDKVGLVGKRAGRGNWPRGLEQVNLNTGQRADRQLDTGDAERVTFCSDRRDLVEQRHAHGHLVHAAGSDDFDELDVEGQRLARERVIGVDGDGLILDFGHDEHHDLALGTLALQLHADFRRNLVGQGAA